MRKVTKPNMPSTAVFSDCVAVIRDKNLRTNLTACTALVTEAELEFESKITHGQIYTIVRETLVNGNVPASDFVDLYTGRMVGNPAGRIHYDALLLAAPQGLCPFCAHRDVSTLDHYLPKTQYPRLSVVPINLVPACNDCNKGKSISYPTTSQQETLHPYYDDIEQDLWLTMTVNQTNPVSVVFSVNRPANWDDLLFERVQEHFTSFSLQKLYSTQAARELSGIKLNLINVYDSGAGTNGVKRLLVDSATSRAAHNPNSWQSALYLGLSDDPWFCAGGFRSIG